MKIRLLAAALSIALMSVNAQSFTNPVLVPGEFNGTVVNSLADPHVFRDDDGTYYMYFTGQGYPCFSSRDLVNWKYEANVFRKNTAKWATRSFWAPEVIKIGNKYYLHYTAAREDDIKKIGVAVADKPTGPFVDLANQPFIDKGEQGTIDSHVFIDDDLRVYMYYTNNLATSSDPGMNGKRRSEVWVVEIKPDFTGFLSEHTMLLYPQQSWEFNPSSTQYWNEGAVVFKNKGTYYLTYSANCYCSANYAVGYATSSSPRGPFIKSSQNPILSNRGVSDFVSGPGHNSIVRSPDNKEWFFVYHSHVNVGNLNPSNNGIRQVNIDRLILNENGTLTVLGPSFTPQNYPSFLQSSINSFQMKQLKVYPTFVSDKVHFNQTFTSPKVELKVTSVTGISMLKKMSTNASVDFSELSPGIYQLTITDEGQRFSTKIIKN